MPACQSVCVRQLVVLAALRQVSGLLINPQGRAGFSRLLDKLICQPNLAMSSNTMSLRARASSRDAAKKMKSSIKLETLMPQALQYASMHLESFV